MGAEKACKRRKREFEKLIPLFSLMHGGRRRAHRWHRRRTVQTGSPTFVDLCEGAPGPKNIGWLVAGHGSADWPRAHAARPLWPPEGSTTISGGDWSSRAPVSHTAPPHQRTCLAIMVMESGGSVGGSSARGSTRGEGASQTTNFIDAQMQAAGPPRSEGDVPRYIAARPSVAKQKWSRWHATCWAMGVGAFICRCQVMERVLI